MRQRGQEEAAAVACLEITWTWTKKEVVPTGKRADLRKTSQLQWAGFGTDWMQVEKGKEPSGWD